MAYTKKEKELLLGAIERSLKAFEKFVTACMKEKQTEAAKVVNEDIKVLMKLDEEIRNEK